MCTCQWLNWSNQTIPQWNSNSSIYPPPIAFLLQQGGDGALHYLPGEEEVLQPPKGRGSSKPPRGPGAASTPKRRPTSQPVEDPDMLQPVQLQVSSSLFRLSLPPQWWWKATLCLFWPSPCWGALIPLNNWLYVFKQICKTSKSDLNTSFKCL